jgi:outer membrane lipoprotein-sorting protein
MSAGRRQFWPVVFAFGLWLAGTSRPYAQTPVQPGWSLPRLMAAMRDVRASSGHFTEQKFVAMLKQPLLSSGRLVYVAPDQLWKETDAPVVSRLIVKGDHVTVVQPDGVRELSLSQYPEIGALVESMRAILAGDAATLSRYYAVTLTGDAREWLLALEPRDDRLRKLLKTIRIQGQGNSVRGVETVEREGDRTVMTITPDPGTPTAGNATPVTPDPTASHSGKPNPG